MMARTGMNTLERSHNTEIIQQPRRFACDRCRMQKLRCERDTWRPSLMPCRRCRKAHASCTISSMERPMSKKSREQLLAVNKSDKASSSPPKHMAGALDLSQHSPPDEFAMAFHNKATAAGVGLPTTSQMNLDGIPEDCFTSGSFDGYTVPVFSGLITPPSADGEHLPVTYMPNDHEWTPPMSDSRSLEYEDRFPCLDNREQHWDQENLRILLDMNMCLLDCQYSVSQKLLMLGHMLPVIAVHNLQTALQSVMSYSQRFLETVRLCVQRDVSDPASCQIATTIAANGIAVSLPTPSQSQRPSCLQNSSTETGLAGQPEALGSASQPTQTYTQQQGRFDDVEVSLTLAIINCYTCLVGSYHIIFSYLLQELMASPPQSPIVFPNLTYATDSGPNRQLHLRCIFNNGMRMLTEIETTLGLPERHSVATLHSQIQRNPEGILSSPASSVLLDSLTSQGFGLCVNGLATGKNSLKEIVQAIQQLLDCV